MTVVSHASHSSFDEIRAATGGVYLVLEVFGRRRPHQAHDRRYYGRRGTRVRALTEAEVAEAYRDKFLREAQVIAPLLTPGDEDELPKDVAQRVHRGLKPSELALRVEEAGEAQPPGWMSVVVLPMPPRRNVLDPVRDAQRFQTAIDIPERWDSDHWPLQYFKLQPTMTGLRSQLPPRDHLPPAYLVEMYRDGVMEYGTTLEPALRRESAQENRTLYAKGLAADAHDYLQAFALAIGDLGYDGPVGAQVSFDHLQGVQLVFARAHGPEWYPLREAQVRGQLWRGERASLITDAGRIVKQVMDLVFLASGLSDGCWFIDADGGLLER